MKTNQICRSCGGEVSDTPDNFEMFEKMHWLCFHLAFEHQTDPDEPCESRLCPIWHLEILKDFVTSKGFDVNEIIDKTVETKWQKDNET